MSRRGVRRRCVGSPSAAATEALAARIGAVLRPGACLLLTGPLGGGKTTFVRGLVAGLGGEPARVLSPTFVLHAVYPGRLTLHHFDAFRLADPAELLRWGQEALFGEEGVAAVEWGGRLRRLLPTPSLLVRFRLRGVSERDILFLAPAGTYAEVFAVLDAVAANPA